MKGPWICYCFALFLILNCYSTTAQPPFDYPTANLSTTWVNTESLPHSVNFTDGSRVRAILLRGSFGPKFACGFYCNGTCTSYLFVVFIVQTNSASGIVQPASGFPQVVWSANRDYPVSYGAVLNLTATGEMVLQDVDGSKVWSTNTAEKSVAGLNMTDDGNLVLVDISGSVVWQSFDHPTDCLVPGQRLFQGQQLIPNKGLFAYVGSNPPQVYYTKAVSGNNTNIGRRYARFLNDSLSLFILSIEPSDPDEVITIPPASSSQYMKLMPDGHLKVFEWQSSWLEVADLLDSYLGECSYPMACGRNGVCSDNQQCSCPITSSRINYFTAVNDRQPSLGCSEITPLTCNATKDQVFITLENVTYFNIIADMERVDIETCKQVCVNNCSCKAAIFQYGSDSSSGDCYLPFELFTMMNVDPDVIHRNASAFIKVQQEAPYHYARFTPTLIFILVSFLFLLGVIGCLTYIICKRRWATHMEEESIGEVPGMPNRFSYEELKTATENFNKKLGEGGFGAVF
ncbi:putative non-specific serine/threonine protein kinase [Helianthus anomalus]